MKKDSPEISLVVPVYNEEENIAPLYEEVVEVLSELEADYELIFVNDASTDSSSSELDKLAEKNDRVQIIELARNFGQQIAFSAGLEFSRGRAVVVMDADLQDSPGAIAEFIDKWREGYEVVYAIRTERKEHWGKKTAYAVFYKMLCAISHIEIPLNAGDFCIMDRKVVDLLNSMPERNRFVRGIRSWVGFKQIGVEVARRERNAGDAKYSLPDLISLALDGLISFSYLPLRVISLMGISVSIVSILLALFYGIKKILIGLSPPGFATLVVMISFFAGVQLITIGVIGEYIGRIFEEVKQRPLYTIGKLRGRRFES